MLESLLTLSATTTPPGTRHPLTRFPAVGSGISPALIPKKEIVMRALGLWLLGVPIWLVIILAVFTDWV